MGLVFLYQRFGVHRNVPGVAAGPAVANKPYTQMTEDEQLQFVDTQEQRISAMMGDLPVKLNDEAVRAIKKYVDRYAAREESVSKNPGAENLNITYAHTIQYVLLIARGS
jgi:L-lactate utilization protein LutC